MRDWAAHIERRDVPDSGFQEDSSERRGASRVRTSREAVFAGGDSLMQEGTVVDVSRDGLQLHTPRPQPVGTTIHAEIRPKEGNPDSESIAVQGKVMRVNDLGTGEHAMGIRFFGSRGIANAPLRRSYPLRAQEFDIGRHVVHAPRMPTVAPRHEESSDDIPLWVWFILLCLLAAIILGALLLKGAASTPAAPNDAVYCSHTDSLEAAAPVPETPPLDEAAAPERAMQPRRGPRAQAAASFPGQRRLSEPAAGPPRDGRQPQPAVWQNAVPPDSAGQNAPHMAPLAEPSKAPDSVPGSQEKRPSLPPKEGVPPPARPQLVGGQKVGARLAPRQGVTEPTDPPNPSHLADLSGSVDAIAPLEATTPPDLDLSAFDVAIHIDQSSFTLTVFVRGEPVRQFPVGLGKGGATPLGAYRITNKLASPDWYNNGSVVPAGDPRNPLGDYWMGLGDESGATSYGLHPTKDPASIGQAASRGCIRLRARDAATLFRLCPVGTPVCITL